MCVCVFFLSSPSILFHPKLSFNSLHCLFFLYFYYSPCHSLRKSHRTSRLFHLSPLLSLLLSASCVGVSVKRARLSRLSVLIPLLLHFPPPFPCLSHLSPLISTNSPPLLSLLHVILLFLYPFLTPPSQLFFAPTLSPCFQPPNSSLISPLQSLASSLTSSLTPFISSFKSLLNLLIFFVISISSSIFPPFLFTYLASVLRLHLWWVANFARRSASFSHFLFFLLFFPLLFLYFLLTFISLHSLVYNLTSTLYFLRVFSYSVCTPSSIYICCSLLVFLCHFLASSYRLLSITYHAVALLPVSFSAPCFTISPPFSLPNLLRHSSYIARSFLKYFELP